MPGSIPAVSVYAQEAVAAVRNLSQMLLCMPRKLLLLSGSCFQLPLGYDLEAVIACQEAVQDAAVHDQEAVASFLDATPAAAGGCPGSYCCML